MPLDLIFLYIKLAYSKTKQCIQLDFMFLQLNNLHRACLVLHDTLVGAPWQSRSQSLAFFPNPEKGTANNRWGTVLTHFSCFKSGKRLVLNPACQQKSEVMFVGI